jgi:hypothetical protein
MSMKKFITASMAALTLAGTSLAAAPASARDWGGYRHHGDDAGYAITGGIVGLALGAVLASHHDHYDHYRYGQPYGYGGYSNYNGYGRYNGYSRYDNYNGYNGYGYSQPYGYNQPYGY